MKDHGHYCKVCGEYKANEKFSGKGHAAHICKKCAALPLDERNEAETVTRIENLPFYLSKEQLAWLKKKQSDKRSDVAALAKEAFSMRFPFAERNERKKQLRIENLSFSVNGEIYNDEFDIPEQLAFTVDSFAKTIEMNNDGESIIVTLTQKEMTSLMRYIINELEIFCWQEDYLREHTDDDNDIEETENTEKNDESPYVWKVDVDYIGEQSQSMVSYDEDMPDRVNELAVTLYSYFVNDEEIDGDIDYDTEN